MKYFLSLLIYGSIIIALGFAAGHPIIGFLLALFIVISLFFAVISGYIEGARFALQKPPPPGETRITMEVAGQEIIFGKEIYFNPPSPDGQAHNFIINNKDGGRPEGSLKDGDNINSPDVMDFSEEAKEILDKQGHKEFVLFCKLAGKNEATIKIKNKKIPFVKN